MLKTLTIILSLGICVIAFGQRHEPHDDIYDVYKMPKGHGVKSLLITRQDVTEGEDIQKDSYFEFDELGNMTQHLEYSVLRKTEADTIFLMWTWEYNEQGDKTGSIMQNDEDYRNLRNYEYEYDNGRKTKMTVFRDWGDGDFFAASEHQYSYDVNSGLLTECNIYRALDGEHKEINLYSYDENGNRLGYVQRLLLTPDADTTVMLSYVYDDRNRLIGEYELNGLGDTLTSEVMTYNEQGQLKTMLRKTDWGYQSTKYYTYNQSGRLIKEVTIGKSNPMERSRIEYRYNEKGLVSEIGWYHDERQRWSESEEYEWVETSRVNSKFNYSYYE